jgi:predicted nucleic acid-binding protein
VILVDSSGWIEFFADGPRADQYAPYVKRPEEIVPPTVVLYEVYRKLRRERGEEFALAVVAQIKRTRLVPLSETLALEAADEVMSIGVEMESGGDLILAHLGLPTEIPHARPSRPSPAHAANPFSGLPA